MEGVEILPVGQPLAACVGVATGGEVGLGVFVAPGEVLGATDGSSIQQP